MTSIHRLTATTVAAGAATLALLVAALPGTAGATTVPADGADSTADADGAAITVLDAGDPATAVVLSLDWRANAPVGALLRNVEQLRMGGSVSVTGQRFDLSVDSELTETREVVSADSTGTTVRVVVEAYAVETTDPLSANMAPDEPKAAIVDIPALVTFDADGTRVGAEFEKLAAPGAEQLLALDALLDAESVVLPDEPLGVGARWTAPFGGIGGGDPLLAEFELTEVTDEAFTVTFHIADIASAFLDDSGLEGGVPGADSTISGTLTASLPGLPVHYAMSTDARLQFSVEDAGLTYDFDITVAQAATLVTV